MLALILFTGPRSTGNSATYDTETPDLQESAKRVTELCKFYEMVTGYEARSEMLTRSTETGTINNTPILSRAFFFTLLGHIK